MATYQIRDPFAGYLTVEGDTIEEAIETAYEDVPAGERPTHVWYEGEEFDVPGGLCEPTE